MIRFVFLALLLLPAVFLGYKIAATGFSNIYCVIRVAVLGLLLLAYLYFLPRMMRATRRIVRFTEVRDFGGFSLVIGEAGVYRVGLLGFRAGRGCSVGVDALGDFDKLLVLAKDGEVYLGYVFYGLTLGSVVRRARSVLRSVGGRFEHRPWHVRASFSEAVLPSPRLFRVSRSAVLVVEPCSAGDLRGVEPLGAPSGCMRVSVYSVVGKGGVSVAALSAGSVVARGEALEYVNRVLLAAKHRPGRGVRIGCTWDGREFLLPEGRHVFVSGMTRSGKTTLLALLAHRLELTGRSVVVVDFTGQFRGLERYGFSVYRVGVDCSVDPFSGLSAMEVVNLLEEISVLRFGEKGYFTPSVSLVVLKAVEASLRGDGSLLDVLAEMRGTASRSDELTAVDAAIRRLSFLGSPGFSDKLPRVSLGRAVVYDLSGLDEMSQVLAANAILRMVWFERGRWRGYVVIDEVHRLARRWRGFEYTSRVLDYLLREGSGYGVNLLLADQSNYAVAAQVLGQCRVRVFFSQLETREVEYVSQFLPIDRLEAYGLVTSLRPGEAIVVTEGGWWPVKIDYFELPEKTVSHAAAPKPSKATRLGSPVDEEKARAAALKYSVGFDELVSAIRSVSVEEVESYLRGEASLETQRKLYSLGIARKGRLTRKGKALIEYYSSTKGRAPL